MRGAFALLAALLVACATPPNVSTSKHLDPPARPANVSATKHLIRVQVVEVTDGDTVKLLYNGQRITARLEQIDAPEKRQPFGLESRAALARLCLGRPAAIAPVDTDRYGRTLVRLHCDGVDANAEQIRTGHAWVYWRYAREVELFDLQTDARRARAGLWGELNPRAPWEFRAR